MKSFSFFMYAPLTRIYHCAKNKSLLESF